MLVFFAFDIQIREAEPVEAMDGENNGRKLDQAGKPVQRTRSGIVFDKNTN